MVEEQGLGPDSEQNPLEETTPKRITEDLHTSVRLFNDAKRGDTRALNELLGRYESRLHRIVRVRLGAQLQQFVESVDIVQETFAVAFQKIDSFDLRSHASILRWLAKIAENKIRDTNAYLFAAKRDRGREQCMDAPKDTANTSGVYFAADQTAVFDRASKHEIRALMDTAMTKLSEDHREVILLRDYSDASWEFVAYEFGRSKSACQELHSRAQVQLKMCVMRLMKNGEQHS